LGQDLVYWLLNVDKLFMWDKIYMRIRISLETMVIMYYLNTFSKQYPFITKSSITPFTPLCKNYRWWNESQSNNQRNISRYETTDPKHPDNWFPIILVQVAQAHIFHFPQFLITVFVILRQRGQNLFGLQNSRIGIKNITINLLEIWGSTSG
jgi:hypothetical protein